MPTMKDIADATGVSAATVSYVLNSRPGTVSPETRARVMKAMRDLNYRPSPLFQRKHASRSNTVGVLHTYRGGGFRQRNMYIFSVVDGILAALMARHCNMTIFANEKWEDIPLSLRTYLDGRCDGLLIVSPPVDSPLISALAERGFPFVVISGGNADAAIPSVDIDNLAAGRMATEYLLSLGHRRIAMLPGSDDFLHNQERVKGYRQALEAAGLSDDPDLVISGWFLERSGHERAMNLLERPRAERPTAFFCSNDTIALGVLAAAEACGLRVPEDVSVVGFDDSMVSHSGVFLTSVRQPLEEITASAVEILMRRIEQDAGGETRKIMTADLAVRNSSGPCPAD